MHLLQSGVSLEIIRDFLGHVDVKTTQIYARANLEMKRRALEKVAGESPSASLPSWQQNKSLLEWLRSPIVYREEADTVARLRALAEDGFSAVRGYHHYVSMAKKNFREHLRGDEVRYKKYLYVLRPLLAARAPTTALIASAARRCPGS